MTTLLALVNEGYTLEYEPSGDADREVELKTKDWVNVWDIPKILNNQEAMSGLVAFRRFQRLGWPLGPWGIHPAPYVEAIEALVRVDEIYHPRLM